MSLHRLVMKADQILHAGAGKGSGFSRTTFTHVPASTLRGAFSAVWWRDHHGADQDEFDSRITGLSFTDAVPTTDLGILAPLAPALDRRVCRARHDNSPLLGHPLTVATCPECDRAMDMSKGVRPLPRGASVSVSTRVTLDEYEKARDECLYEREGLDARGVSLVALVAGDPSWLVTQGTVIRAGACSTVAGRITVSSVEPVEPTDVVVPQGDSRLRVETLTPGVYVDDFGRPAPEPSTHDLHLALGVDSTVTVRVERAFVRWATAAGWHTKAGRPKPEDPAVIAHSAYHVAVSAPRATSVPSIVTHLGLRTSEGCGWAAISNLEEVA